MKYILKRLFYNMFFPERICPNRCSNGRIYVDVEEVSSNTWATELKFTYILCDACGGRGFVE